MAEQLPLCDAPTVIPQMTKCPEGHDYEKNLPGICPECFGEPKEIHENPSQAA